MSNFELLRKERPVLADLGRFAETYAYSDPSSSLVKLRSLAEQLTKAIYWELKLEKPIESDFASRLVAKSFRDAIPEVICSKLHAIRKEGNKAAHGGVVETKHALWILREAYEVSAWFVVRCFDVKHTDIREFSVPAENTVDVTALQSEKKAIESKLEAAILELNKVKDDYKAREVKAESIAKGQKAADALQYDEATTRKRLIDVSLAEAGWDVSKPDDVTIELEVGHQPTDSGIGYIDYVLWDDNGKPLAVVEAKKTSVSEQQGKKQAELYADGLEKTHGQRPIIFYTNGYNIWIWDDGQGYPPRRLFGFYSKSSLQNLVNFQRNHKNELSNLSPDPSITGRIYQVETIKRVCETFAAKRRKALIVQATGTGKTRVAIALSELLIRAKWAKRILFLCDRRELVKQAKNAFNDHMDDPLTVVSRHTVNDTKSRIFVATYPSMQGIFQAFDVGFFDLIIADESHRSIYNRYRDLFRYFDALQVGLTATPVEFIARNTFGLFGCDNQDPTASYSLEKAVDEGYLTPYEVHTHTTAFLREGIKYKNLTEEQKRQLEEDGESPELLNHEARSVDKQIYNKDTNRIILRNLMENGIRDPSGQLPGKTIVFARNHKHAVLMQEMFDEMYPQYGGKFCQVIDNYDPRAEQLIDDFKGQGTNDELTIAISVDMLDTGIDVPEIVNLVFAKPVMSKVKFWQMIGRGTRLCPGLFGPDKDKTIFRIFDHWGNFEYFEQNKPEVEPAAPTSLMQRVFNARIDLAEKSLNAMELNTFKAAVKLLEQDLASLPDDSISIKEKWAEILALRSIGVIEAFTPATQHSLKTDIGPLMQWINIRGHSEAYKFDLMMTQTQVALIDGTNTFEDLKGELLNAVNRLQMHLNPVKEKAETIKAVRSSEFWTNVNHTSLENVRTELRSIMQYVETKSAPTSVTPVIDIEEDTEAIKTGERSTGIRTIDLAAYRKRVEEVLNELLARDLTLQKIKAGKPVENADIEKLISLVLTRDPNVDLNILREFYPDLADNLDVAIRNLIGMDEAAVRERFQSFVIAHPSLTAKQTQFVGLLQNLIAKNGGIELSRLLDAPFTNIHQDGIEGVFADETMRNDLIETIKNFDHPLPESTNNEASPQ